MEMQTISQVSSEDLLKLQDKDVRIVHLPPMTIAAAYAEGTNTESRSIDMILKFVADNDLLSIKPDARCFGFDCSPQEQGNGVPSTVYETWVSIPDDMLVPPLIKRKFSGGLYAAHVLRAWDFEDWRRLFEWVSASDKYVNDYGSTRWVSPRNQGGAILRGNSELLQLRDESQDGEHTARPAVPDSVEVAAAPCPPEWTRNIHIEAVSYGSPLLCNS